MGSRPADAVRSGRPRLDPAADGTPDRPAEPRTGSLDPDSGSHGATPGAHGSDSGSHGAAPGAHGSDFLQLDASQAPVGGKAEWLARRLRQAMADGRLVVGSRLPPTRVLAAELHVSRGVVTDAYRRLTEEGHIQGRRRGGTVVVAAPLLNRTPLTGDRTGATRDGPCEEGSWSAETGRVGGDGSRTERDGRRGGAGRGDRTGRRERAGRGAGPAHGGHGGQGDDRGDGVRQGARSAAEGPPSAPGGSVLPSFGALFAGEPGPEVFDVLRAVTARIDFTPGQPDLASFPRAAWLRAERAVLAELSAANLGYGDPRGDPRLRRAVADWLARSRGIRVEPAEVLIVAGTAQALTLLHPVLRADGIHSVAVEDPGSLGTRQHLRNGGLGTPPVPVDEEGVRVDALRATGARAVLLTPAHQFPTGVVTSGERRRELLGWAAEGGLIVEDDYDAEHRYDRPPVPALRGLLAEQVCYTGSVSKLLAPALRTGWIVPPPRYRDALVDAKRFTDLGNAVLPQLVLARLMESGDLERHLRLLRGRHRRRRDAMIGAIAVHLPGAVVHGAAAGLHLTVTYAPKVPDHELAAAALARGVKCQPLSWHRQSAGRPGLVLGYAASPSGVIAEGVAALGEALRDLS